MEVLIFGIKSINFCIEKVKIPKIFYLTAGYLSEIDLGGKQIPAAPCAGAKMNDFYSFLTVTLRYIHS